MKKINAVTRIIMVLVLYIIRIPITMMYSLLDFIFNLILLIFDYILILIDKMMMNSIKDYMKMNGYSLDSLLKIKITPEEEKQQEPTDEEDSKL